MFVIFFVIFILLGFRYLASALPLLSLIGVGIGVGVIFSMLLLGLSRNPSVSNYLVRWAFIGFSLVEVSGFIGLVFALLSLYALFSFSFFNFPFRHFFYWFVIFSFKLFYGMFY